MIFLHKRFTLLVLIGCGLLLAAACGAAPVETEVSPTPTRPSPQEIIVTRIVQQEVPVVAATPSAVEQPITLDVSLIGGIETLDPHAIQSENEQTLVANLFAGLTRMNPRTKEIEPQLAAEWTISPDGRTWTFDLRRDVSWVRPVPSSGLPILDQEATLKEVEAVRPIIADDFVYAIRRACEGASQTPNVFVLFLIEGCESLNRQRQPSAVDLERVQVTAVDPFTLQFRLTQPANYFLTLTSLPIMRPVPTEIVAETAFGDWSMDEEEELMSSGPYVLSPRTIMDTRIVLEKNPFWPLDGGGNVDLVNLYQFDSSAEAYELWIDRDLDVSRMPPNQQEELLGRIPQKVTFSPQQEVFYMVFNFDSELFSSPALRRAFAAAIDREEIIEEVYEGLGEPMRHLSAPGAYGAPPIDQLGVGYDPDYARQQLSASGRTACRFLPQIRYMVHSSDAALFQAELVREMWVEELGCEEEQIVIEQVQFGTLLAATRPDAGADRPDVWDLGWSAYFPDAHNWLADLLHCTESDNRMNRPCGAVDDQMIRAARAPVAQRPQLYRGIETDLFGMEGLYPVAPIYVRGRYLLRQTWVVFQPSGFGGEVFDTYYVDWELKQIEQQQ